MVRAVFRKLIQCIPLWRFLIALNENSSQILIDCQFLIFVRMWICFSFWRSWVRDGCVFLCFPIPLSCYGRLFSLVLRAMKCILLPGFLELLVTWIPEISFLLHQNRHISLSHTYSLVLNLCICILFKLDVCIEYECSNIERNILSRSHHIVLDAVSLFNWEESLVI